LQDDLAQHYFWFFYYTNLSLAAVGNWNMNYFFFHYWETSVLFEIENLIFNRGKVWHFMTYKKPLNIFVFGAGCGFFNLVC
jgi:hypothetical protein